MPFLEEGMRDGSIPAGTLRRHASPVRSFVEDENEGYLQSQG